MNLSERIQLSGVDALALNIPQSEFKAHLSEVLTRTLDAHDESGVVSIVFVTDDEIRRVHREFMDDDTPTDVITFPLDPDGDPDIEGAERLVGELVVSHETAYREAKERSLSFELELCLYALHGVLHLLGFDDMDDDDRRAMREAEAEFLAHCRF